MLFFLEGEGGWDYSTCIKTVSSGCLLFFTSLTSDIVLIFPFMLNPTNNLSEVIPIVFIHFLWCLIAWAKFTV